MLNPLIVVQKLIGFILFAVLLNGTIRAQEIEYGAEFFGFADNREYKSEVQIPQTIFGFHLIPKLNVTFDTIHGLNLGANFMKEFGSEHFFDKVHPYIYYHQTGKKFDFRFGSFPRESVLSDSPKVIYYDSLSYYRPYVSGLFWTYAYKHFYQSVYLDWTSRKADNVRETFIMGGEGNFLYKMLFVHNYAYMYHYANQMVPDPNDPVRVRDNGVVLVRLGLDATKITLLDSLSISAAGIQSFERKRGLEDWNRPQGLMIEAVAEYKGFGVRNSLYRGDGHNLDWGDPFYRLKRYNRTDVFYKLIAYKRVTAVFTSSLHFAQGKVSHQQQFILKVDVNSSKASTTKSVIN